MAQDGLLCVRAVLGRVGVNEPRPSGAVAGLDDSQPSVLDREPRGCMEVGHEGTDTGKVIRTVRGQTGALARQCLCGDLISFWEEIGMSQLGTGISRQPERTSRFFLSRTIASTSEKWTVKPASQIGPMHMSDCWNPGMTFPVRGKSAGRSGIQ